MRGHQWFARRRAALVLASAVGIAVAGLSIAVPAQATRVVVPAETAQTKVVKKVPGSVLSIARAKRDGFSAWAVTVKRKDGSIVVGYVDIKSGIIFDWTVQQGPGEPTIDLDGSGGGLTPAKPPADPTRRSGTSAGDGSTSGDGSGSQDAGSGTAGGGASPTSPTAPTAPDDSDDADDADDQDSSDAPEADDDDSDGSDDADNSGDSGDRRDREGRGNGDGGSRDRGADGGGERGGHGGHGRR